MFLFKCDNKRSLSSVLWAVMIASEKSLGGLDKNRANSEETLNLLWRMITTEFSRQIHTFHNILCSLILSSIFHHPYFFYNNLKMWMSLEDSVSGSVIVKGNPRFLDWHLYIYIYGHLYGDYIDSYSFCTKNESKNQSNINY